MSKANEALKDVRGWLCDNLSDGDAGKVCGMLSLVSRHVNELEEANANLRELVRDMCEWAYVDSDCNLDDRFADRMRELGIEVE